MICDKDPSVMGASLGLLHAMIIDTPNNFKDLVPSLVSILKQVADHRLPKEYDYHRVPAPWIQMHLLRMLAVLGRGDRAASEGNCSRQPSRSTTISLVSVVLFDTLPLLRLTSSHTYI